MKNLHNEESSVEERKKSNTSMSNYRTQDEYETIKRKRMEKLLSTDTIDKSEKLHTLKTQIQILSEKEKMSQEKARARGKN